MIGFTQYCAAFSKRSECFYVSIVDSVQFHALTQLFLSKLHSHASQSG